MRKKTLFLLLLVIFMPFMNVDAAWYCESSEKVKLQKLASNIGYSYDYIEENNSVNFTIKLYNISQVLYIQDANEKTYHPSKDMDEIIITNYAPGQTVKFDIYSTVENCDETVIYTIYVVLPPYNKYYKNSVCEGLTDYKYCQKWASINLTEEEFVNTVNEYKNKTDEPIEDDDKNIDDGINLIIEFYIKYYYYILPTIIIVGIGIIIYHNKKDTFGF